MLTRPQVTRSSVCQLPDISRSGDVVIATKSMHRLQIPKSARQSTTRGQPYHSKLHRFGGRDFPSILLDDLWKHIFFWQLKRLVTLLTYRRYINNCIYSIYLCPCSNVGMQDGHTDRQTRMTNIHFVSSTTHTECNYDYYFKTFNIVSTIVYWVVYWTFSFTHTSFCQVYNYNFRSLLILPMSHLHVKCMI